MVKRKTLKRSKKTKKAHAPDIPVVDVYSLSGKKVDKFKLNPVVFNSNINKPLMHQVMVMYRANERQGNASTKKRGEVRGGGKKPWRQKGTGRARSGSIRSPLWVGGGVVFGPHKRDYSFSLPRELKKNALISSLSASSKDGEIMVLEENPALKEPKTKEVARILKALKIYRKRVLFLCSSRDENLIKSCRNIENLSLKESRDFNAYDVLSNSKVVFSKDTHSSIVKRLA